MANLPEAGHLDDQRKLGVSRDPEERWIGADYTPAMQDVADAYLRLMMELPYSKITVKDVAAEARISRTAFYRCFESLYDLLESIEQYAIGRLGLYEAGWYDRARDAADDDSLKGKPFESIMHWFETVYELKYILTPLTGINGDSYFADRLAAKLRTDIYALMDDERVPNDRLRTCYAYASAAKYIGLLKYVASTQNSENFVSVFELASIANSDRVAYFRFRNVAPQISDEQLFGDA